MKKIAPSSFHRLYSYDGRAPEFLDLLTASPDRFGGSLHRKLILVDEMDIDMKITHFNETNEPFQSFVREVSSNMGDPLFPSEDDLLRIVQRYLPEIGRLRTFEVLTRLKKRYVSPTEKLIWCGEFADSKLSNEVDDYTKLKPSWLLISNENLYLLQKKTEPPQIYPVEDLFLDCHDSWIRIFRKNPVLPSDIFFKAGLLNGARPGPKNFDYPRGLRGRRARYEFGDALVVGQYSDQLLFALAGLDIAKQFNTIREKVLGHERKVKQNSQKKPGPRLIRKPHEAEIVAAEWMRYFGFHDAKETPAGPDSGIDVNSSSSVVQVKMEGIQTSRPMIQALFGVATAEAKLPVFFSLGGYTADAINWATRVGMPIFIFDLQGQPEPVNGPARELFQGSSEV